MFARMREDIRTVFSEDPAARTIWEILTCYPGLHAIWFHRIAHALWRRKFRFIGRLISHLNRTLTGIEIHPAARIGRRFFIDHGMGIVIGETSEIGDDVLMYKGVVLGGTCLEKTKRHPTIGNGVVVGSNAVVLGPIQIGDNAKIGSGAVVVKPVPAGATVVGVPGRIVRYEGGVAPPTATLDHSRLPDPVVQALTLLTTRVEELESQVHEMEASRRSRLDVREDQQLGGEESPSSNRTTELVRSSVVEQ